MTVKVREMPPKSGKWYVKIDFHQHRIARLFSSKERAQEVAKKIGDALELYGVEALKMFKKPDPPPPPPPEIVIPTVAEYAAKWELELEKKDLKHSTRISYKSNLKHHIIPALGKVLITKVDYPLLKRFVCAKAEATYSSARFRKPADNSKDEKDTASSKVPGHKKTYSRDSVRIMVMTLRAMLAEATRENLIPNNPVNDLAPFYRRQKRERIVRRSDVYTPEELYAIEDVLSTKRSLFQQNAYEFSLCMSRTGMRMGEARGLKPSDLDFNAHTIEIQRNIPSGHNRLEESTKGKIGHRTVDMGKDLHLAVKAIELQRKVEKLKTGTEDSSAWLFHGAEGGPMDYNKFYDDWMRAQKIAGIRPRTPHSLRHTYASINLANGEDLAYVQKQLGHANPAITLAIYTHFMPRKRRRISNALDRPTGVAKRKNPQVIRK
ncbi:MAG: site-specific integrase [Acidobacteria bacterium]|nr:site-specific integrase [Acidobacteriota bacterium]